MAIHFGEFDRDQLQFGEHLGVEEERRGVEGLQQLPVVFLDHRFKLVDVSDKQELLSAEGFTHVVAVNAQHLVDKVDDIGTYHADLINDDEFEFADDLDLFAIVSQRLADVSWRKLHVIG